MKAQSGLFCLLQFLTPIAQAQSRGTAQESAAIMGTITHWDRGWEIRDRSLGVQDYAPDADWTNAFGMRRVGRNSIRAFLAEVFRLPFPDVAVLRTRARRIGQKLPDGRVEEPRRINHLRVFAKREGTWLDG